VGRTIPKDSAKPGDLVLFTGTDSTERFVGHMGIITSNQNGAIEFIHSTSGKAFSLSSLSISFITTHQWHNKCCTEHIDNYIMPDNEKHSYRTYRMCYCMLSV